MSDKTRIEWTDATWNPVTGCTKVSDGCKHCYAERDWARLSANPDTRYYGRPFTDVQCHGDVLDLPLRWKKPRRVFVNSMSDLFHDAVPWRFIADVFGVMASCPRHTFQVLTKRPERMNRLLSLLPGFLSEAVAECMALYTDAPLVWPLPNVWLGVSVEDQATADQRIPLLLNTPAALRWVSAEPLLGPVDLRPYLDWSFAHADMSRPDLDWVVAGGESGPKARPMHPDWLRTIRDHCFLFVTPFLFKQWGEWGPYDRSATDGATLATTNSLDTPMQRFGKKAAGRHLYGQLHDEYPEERS
jgi:protein gp37